MTIETVATPWVNHAMAHTGLPFLRRVIVDLKASGVTPAEATARVLVRDAFGTQITRDWARSARDLDPAVPWELDDLDIRFDPAAVSGIEEEADAEIEVAVEFEGERVAVSHTPLRVLASRQWVLDPRAPLLSLELLAAFVQPNHPSIAALLPAIGERLAKATGSGSLGLAGRTPEGIDKVVAAAFEVVHDREIYYAAPPASWGYGQKVRTPGDVLDDRVGTCLDTTLTLAAVLEQIGIPPVVWIGTGHAFLGYWRHLDRGLPDAASTSVAQAANAVDLKLMGVVETTMVTREKRPPKDLFRRAAQEPHDSWFTGRSHQLLGVVDVAMARMLRVHPLPARRLRPDGVTEVVEYVPPVRDEVSVLPAARAEGEGPVERAEAGPIAPPRIQGWKKALLDLTLRNKLLNLDQPMTQVRLQVPSGELGRLASMLQSGRVISVRAYDDLSGAVLAATERNAHAIPGDVLRDMLEVRATIYSEHSQATHQSELDRVRFRAQSGRRETGANPLVLTLGRVDWKLGDRDLSAPLVLVPAEIRGLTMPYRIALDSSGDISINHSLLEKLRTEFGFTVPTLDELPVTEDGLVDVAEILHRFRAALDAAQLPFRIVDEARLTISGFTGYLLWRDLDEHWSRFLESPLVRHLVETPTQEYADPAETAPGEGTSGAGTGGVPTLDELVAVSPIPADGSQAEAIALARAGRSFVLEGPPGTGKSQTITNILVDQMVQGRRVLFVAEKGAALDVVRKRLGEVGMLPYTLDLHDHNARPATVKAGLKAALAQQAQPDADGYRVAGQDVGAATALLVGYRDRLHQANAAGLSLWSAHAQELARGDGPTLPVSTSAVVREGFDAGELRRAVAAAVAPLAELGTGAAAAWGFAGPTGAGADEVMAAVARVERALGGAGSMLPPEVARWIGTVADLRAVAWLLTEPGLGDRLGELGSGRWGDALAELRGRTAELAGRGGAIVGQFAPGVLEVDFGGVRQDLREAQASFFLGRKGRLVRAAGPVLAHLRPGAEVDAKGLPDLVERIAGIAGEQAALRDAWRSLPGMADVAGLTLADPAVEPEIEALESARLEAARLLGGLTPTLARAVIAARGRGPGVEDSVPGHVAAPLRELAEAWSALAEATHSRSEDQAQYAGESGLLAAWAAGTDARRDPSLLGRWRRAAEALGPLAGSADEARWELLTGGVAAEDAPAAFDRGVAAASFAERWAAGGFEEFHPASHDRAAERFVSAGAALRTSLKSVLPAAVLGRRPFKPAGSGRAVFGRAAALDRELNRSRGGASVRQLIADHGAVIGEVTPCVLVSPDSLARFVPPGAMEFDLVVFDEASQIRVPDAIGALGRARACVVAGDSKQLPPTMFAQISVDEEDEADDEFVVVPDEESLLGECVQAGLPRHWLSWHYRSTDESLIAFSNDKYYEGRLSSFPAFPASQFDSGISFTRVDGQFIRSVSKGEGPREKGLLRTNPVEATAVVDEVLRRWRQRERSIGVVTFNVQQRNLIQRMLWESGVEGVAESLVLADDGLFVKNLENVQGDERDVIIFSTAFSANASGTLPLNFGPLNRAGGERRLNVAVTRARRRVMVFSSFDPEDIRVEQTNSVGVRHLRSYLELARDGVAPAVVQRVGAVDRHRDDLAEALRERGLEVETNVGLSDFRLDLVVSDPARGDRSALAVLLDGPGWAERATTGDRDGLPEQVLRTIMGWPAIERVWLPEWLGDREGALGRLVEAVAAVDGRLAVGEATSQAVFTPYEPGGDSPVLDSGEEAASGGAEVDDPGPVGGHRGDQVDVDEADPLALLTSTVTLDEGPYAEPEPAPRPRGRLDRIGYPGQASQSVSALMSEIIAAVGPISPRRVARIVVAAHGISRLTEQRFTTLRELLPGDVRRDSEGFLWPAERDPLRWEAYRSSSDLKDRPLDDIALREIANAQCDLVRRAVGISIDELFRETMRVFGGTRATDSTRDRLAAALNGAVADGRLRIAGDIVSPA